MKFELRERDRHALLGLAIALAAYFLFSMAVFPGYDALKAGAQTAADKEEQLMKYRRALIRKGHYGQLLEQARKNVAEAESRLIRGDNASLASVELQTIVEDAAKKFDIPLSQRSMSAAKKKDNFYNEITMTLAFDCTPNQLTSFMSELRAAPKFVVVRNAQVVPTEVLQAAPPHADFKKMVRVNLTLGGILSSAPVAAKG